MRDWHEWHGAYADPDSSLSRRLLVVRRRLREALGLVDSGDPGLLSLCAGDGRDVIPTLASLGDPGRRVNALLVELDRDLAQRAASDAREAGLDRVTVRTADAGDPSSFADVLPVHVLVLCGVFGNVDRSDIRRTVASIPALVRSGGFVIWTRGGSEPDQRGQVRQWMAESGLHEIAFDGAPEPFGIGMNRLAAQGHDPSRLDLGPDGRLFTFEEASRPSRDS